MKKLVVYTSSRADYGLLRPLIDRLKKSSAVKPVLFVTGTHLSDQYGRTIDEIKAEHADIIGAEVNHSLGGQDYIDTAKAMSEALLAYAQNLQMIKPDYALVLGDRYEAMSFGLACATLMIPIFHIHGGELTYGALDDKFRHCLTKLSDYHFASCEKYRKRIIQMGENPDCVYNVGALGVDNALNASLLSKAELEKQLGFSLAPETYLVTFHPETNSVDFGAPLLKAMLKKIYERVDQHQALVIITGVNSDVGANAVRNEIENFVKSNPAKIKYFESLGMLKYLTCLKYATAVVGNTSSGILEAHSLGTPALNIGHRQDGRERELSVVDLVTTDNIEAFDFKSLSNLKKGLILFDQSSLFGNGQSSTLITRYIEDIVTRHQVPKFKMFYDL